MRQAKKNIIRIDYDEMKRRIDKKGWTLKQTAAELGWDGGYLNRDKCEGRGGLRKRDAEYLCTILECDLEDITVKEIIPEPVQAPTRAADLTNEELIQELMKRLLTK